jgi:hypothetical protein
VACDSDGWWCTGTELVGGGLGHEWLAHHDSVGLVWVDVVVGVGGVGDLGVGVDGASLVTRFERDSAVFREIAGFYLTNQLPAAEKTARQLVILAAAEPGAWRLLALVTRAQGQLVQAAKYDRRAARLDLARV